MATIAGRRHSHRGGCVGAIAQLGERVVRNDEVGGSIPPGSTTLRPSGYAWRSHAGVRRAKRGARRSLLAKTGWRELNYQRRLAFPLRATRGAATPESEERSVVPGEASWRRRAGKNYQRRLAFPLRATRGTA